MGQKQKRYVVAIAKNTSASHDVGRPSAAPHSMVAAASGGRHHVVVHHGDREYIFCFCLRMLFMLLARFVFSAFGLIKVVQIPGDHV